MPGSRHAFAMFDDKQSGLMRTIALGEAVRNSVLSQIFDNRVELALADQKVELALAQIADGSGATTSQVAASQPAAQTPSTPRRKAGGKPSLGLSGYILSPAELVERLGLTAVATHRTVYCWTQHNLTVLEDR